MNVDSESPNCLIEFNESSNNSSIVITDPLLFFKMIDDDSIKSIILKYKSANVPIYCLRYSFRDNQNIGIMIVILK